MDKPTKPFKSLNLSVTIQIEDIIDALFNLDNDRVIAFVKKLDQEGRSWPLTKSLHEYFVEEMKNYGNGGKST